MSKSRMKLYKKGRKYYFRPTENGKPVWKPLAETKAESEEMIKEYLEQRKLKKSKVPNTRVSIDAVIDRYLMDKFSSTLTTKSSQKRYSCVMRRFQVFMRQYNISRVSQITVEMVKDYLNQRHEEVSGKTWNMERLVLFNFFKHCIDNDRALENPVEKVDPKKLGDSVVEHLDEEEVHTLLEYMRRKVYSVPYYEIIKVILYTGMRVNEAIHLTKRDVDLQRWFIIVQEKTINGKVWRPKTKQRRFIPIPEEIRDIILQQMETEGELLFQNTRGKPLVDRRILERLQAACEKAGVKKVHVHSLRHTFCSMASMKGIDPQAIQEVLGHKSDSMTRRYRHLKPGYLQETFEGFKYNDKED